EVAALVTDAVGVPTIGIGAGPRCDGQVLVYHDLLGLAEGTAPRFVRRYADVGDIATRALTSFATDVRSGAFPAEAESYHLAADGGRALREAEAAKAAAAETNRTGVDLGAIVDAEGARSARGKGRGRVVPLDGARSRRRS